MFNAIEIWPSSRSSFEIYFKEATQYSNVDILWIYFMAKLNRDQKAPVHYTKHIKEVAFLLEGELV